MQILKELSVFNNIKYYDEPHTYYINGVKSISCTGLIHKFEEEFEIINPYEESDFLSPEEEDSLPTVILVGGLDTGSYKNIGLQKNLLQKGLGSGYNNFFFPDIYFLLVLLHHFH